MLDIKGGTMALQYDLDPEVTRGQGHICYDGPWCHFTTIGNSIHESNIC